MRKGIPRLLLVVLVVATPLLFVANVWQSYRFSRVEQRLATVQQRHLELLEENKRLIVGIAGLRSPSRIRDLAEADLGLEEAPADRVERIRYGRPRRDGGEDVSR